MKVVVVIFCVHPCWSTQIYICTTPIWFSFLFPFQASQDKKSLDVGANLFVGNLDPVSFVLFLFDTLYILFAGLAWLIEWENRTKILPHNLHKWYLTPFFLIAAELLCLWHYIVFSCRMWMKNFFMILLVRLELLLQIPR